MISLSVIPIDGSEGILKSISECPKGTIECKEVGCSNTCYCEDHCSWEKCFLEVPPSQCLLGTSGGWKLNTRKMYWTAELSGALMHVVFNVVTLYQILMWENLTTLMILNHYR